MAVSRTLPPRLFYRHGAYYYVKRYGKTVKWLRVADDLDSALVKYRSIEHNIEQNSDWRPHWAEMKTYLREVYRVAKRNARNREISFSLTKEEYGLIVERARMCCELTGIAFELRLRPGSLRRPFAPSLDRIRAADPYHFGNCRLVCGIVNAALSDWGDAIFWKMVNAAKRRRVATGQYFPPPLPRQESASL